MRSVTGWPSPRCGASRTTSREPARFPRVLMSNWSPKVAAVPLQSLDSNNRTVRAPHSDATERELLERIARTKDQAAFRTLYGNYYQRLSRLLARMSVRREDIEEVINDTFWVVWTKASEFRGASQLSTWIIGIAYRRALNALRRAKLRPVADEPFDEDSVSVESTDDEEMNQQWLSQGLERLPVEQRMALELTYTLRPPLEERAPLSP